MQLFNQTSSRAFQPMSINSPTTFADEPSH